MDKLETFEHSEFGNLRVRIEEDGQIWYCLTDICNALELSSVPQVADRLKPNGVKIIEISNDLGWPKIIPLNFINESNLYRCIFQSRKEKAEEFQDWVFEEVLPSIRKWGMYLSSGMTEAEIVLQHAQRLVNQERELKRQSKLISSTNKRVDTVEIAVKELKDWKSSTESNYISIAGFASLYRLHLGDKLAQSFGKQATKLCKQRAINKEFAEDPRWGTVGLYPQEIVKEIFLSAKLIS
jgi:prophage antirepressor-like protein